MSAGAQGGLSSLRRLLRERPRTATERCGLCGAALPPEHLHVLDPGARELKCSCSSCATLFAGGAKWKRVAPLARPLRDFQLSDAQWDALGLPIGLAFFFRSSAAPGVVAFYPSPAGATESRVPAEAWEALAAANPALASLAEDTEALLVHRLDGAREQFLVSIDECYRLVGLVRLHWRGFGGGARVREELAAFFARLAGERRDG